MPAMAAKTETGDCVVVPADTGVPGTGGCGLVMDDGEDGTVVGDSVEVVIFIADVAVIVTEIPGVTVTEGVAMEVAVTETSGIVEEVMDMPLAQTGAQKTARTRRRTITSVSFNDNLFVIKDS